MLFRLFYRLTNLVFGQFSFDITADVVPRVRPLGISTEPVISSELEVDSFTSPLSRIIDKHAV